MNSRVRIPAHYVPKESIRTGTVVGIAATNVIFSYIVLLDEWIDTEYGPTRALSISGAELESEDGSTHWRLT